MTVFVVYHLLFFFLCCDQHTGSLSNLLLLSGHDPVCKIRTRASKLSGTTEVFIQCIVNMQGWYYI